MALDLPVGPKISYARQYRRCGKERCSICRDGQGHGPYWYAFWEEDGRSRSRYLGKRPPVTAAPDGHAQGAPAGEVDVLPDSGRPTTSVQSARLGSLRARTLGGFTIWLGAEQVPTSAWRKRKAATLLKCLLSADGHHLHRDQLLEVLWPAHPPTAAAQNLHYTTHLLRRILDAPGNAGSHLQLRDEMLLLLPGAEELLADEWLDATTFSRQARAALAGQDRAACRAALALYGGEYLPDDRYADWAIPRRQELHGLHIQVLLHAASLGRAQGDATEAIGFLRALLADDRYHEPAARLLMELLTGEGRHHECEAVYRSLQAALHEDLGAAPAAETIRLHARLLAHPGNLPTSLSSFIGREEEQATLGQLLRTTRLLTLTGAGGSGKTRLALTVATALRRSFGHGAWLVELASLGDPTLVPQRVATALGVREQTDQSLPETLASYLGERELLLVLDNCEHLLGPCAMLAATLLGACPGLRILVTSRELLGVAGETVWRVPSLSLPPLLHLPGSSGPVDAQPPRRPESTERTELQAARGEARVAMLAQSEAVQLFVARAQASRRDFVLQADNAAIVARICRQLDGLPLAIELAAARVRLLPMEGIAARLDGHFGLLAGGPRTVLPRHQTLWAAMDWGHHLLAERERALFRRLAVFAGGWTLGAAEIVCAGEGIKARDVLDVLAALVNKSLVVFAEQDGEGRYRFLEVVRQFAWEHATSAAESTALKERHLGWCAALAEQAEPELRGPGQAEWLARLDTDIDNLRAALAWSRQEESQAAQGERLATLLGRFWVIRGYLSEGRRWLAEMLASAVPVPTAIRAGTLAAAGRLAYYQSDFTQATERYKASLTLCKANANGNGMAAAYNGLGLVLVEQGEFAQAVTLFEHSLALSRDCQDPWATAGTLNNLGLVAQRQGEYGRTAAWLEESLSLYRQLGDTQGTANTLNTWGVAAMDAGDLGRATTLLEESLALHRELGSAHGVAIALSNLGMLARQGGELGRAAALLREGLTIFQELGAEGDVCVCLEVLALIAGAAGQHERAARLFGAAEARRQALGVSLTAAEDTEHLSAMEATQGALGNEAFSRCRIAGRAAPLEQPSDVR